jgi:flagellar FliJ protein
MFTFKLQSVLDHRQFVEDNLKKEHAEIKLRLMAEQQKLESLEKKEMQTRAALKLEQVQGLSSHQVVAYHAYLKGLADQMSNQKAVIGEIREEETIKQAALLQAMKKRQILEKLKEQEHGRFNRKVLKKEMTFIDEIAVNQYVRKGIEKRRGGQ